MAKLAGSGLMVCLAALLAGCGGGDGEENINNQEVTVPAPYAGMVNPFAGDAAAAAAGQKIFNHMDAAEPNVDCAACHGAGGRGDGPDAAMSDPDPGDLPLAASMFGDDYLHWRIAEGGSVKGKKNDMQSWKTMLTTNQIWQLVTYIRTLQ